jgi:hypothetical protein
VLVVAEFDRPALTVFMRWSKSFDAIPQMDYERMQAARQMGIAVRPPYAGGGRHQPE